MLIFFKNIVHFSYKQFLPEPNNSQPHRSLFSPVLEHWIVQFKGLQVHFLLLTQYFFFLCPTLDTKLYNLLLLFFAGWTVGNSSLLLSFPTQYFTPIFHLFMSLFVTVLVLKSCCAPQYMYLVQQSLIAISGAPTMLIGWLLTHPRPIGVMINIMQGMKLIFFF